LGQKFATANWAPEVRTRMLVALCYLKYQHDLSDEAVAQQWIESFYWHYFSGEQFLKHEMPIDPSRMRRHRPRLG